LKALANACGTDILFHGGCDGELRHMSPISICMCLGATTYGAIAARLNLYHRFCQPPSFRHALDNLSFSVQDCVEGAR